MVNPVTGLFEQAQMYYPLTAFICQQLLDNKWLARYPQPRKIGFDNGGDDRAEFKEFWVNMGLKVKTSLPQNPQSIAILERIHKVLTDYLTIFELEVKEINKQDEDPFAEYITVV